VSAAGLPVVRFCVTSKAVSVIRYILSYQTVVRTCEFRSEFSFDFTRQQQNQEPGSNKIPSCRRIIKRFRTSDFSLCIELLFLLCLLQMSKRNGAYIVTNVIEHRNIYRMTVRHIWAIHLFRTRNCCLIIASSLLQRLSYPCYCKPARRLRSRMAADQ
jgi:hypothetical protein